MRLQHHCETGIFSTNGHAFTSINVWGEVAQCVDAYCGVWCRVTLCCISAGLNIILTNGWVQQKMVVPEKNGLFEQLHSWPNTGTGTWKRRSKELVMAATEGEIDGKCLAGRRTVWIDGVRWWTIGGLPAARPIALDRL